MKYFEANQEKLQTKQLERAILWKKFRGQSWKIKNETITGKSQNNYWPISKLYAAKKNSEGQCVPCSWIIYGVAYSEVWAAAVFDTK